MIDDFFALRVNEQDAVLKLTTKTNQRIVVLDQWEDDKTQTILVKAHTWSDGDLRFVLTGLDYQTSAAFRFPDSESARTTMNRHLMSRRRPNGD